MTPHVKRIPSSVYKAPFEQPDQHDRNQLNGFADLDHASSGNMIRELESRGYRVFLQQRVAQYANGWWIAATQAERKSLPIKERKPR